VVGRRERRYVSHGTLSWKRSVPIAVLLFGELSEGRGRESAQLGPRLKRHLRHRAVDLCGVRRKAFMNDARSFEVLEGGRLHPLPAVLTAMEEKPTFPITDVLAKCEVKCLNAWIKKLDLEGSVLHRALLSDQLIEAGLANLTCAIGF
jgi:hypothetical protein